jgi:hypothetical protein
VDEGPRYTPDRASTFFFFLFSFFTYRSVQVWGSINSAGVYNTPATPPPARRRRRRLFFFFKKKRRKEDGNIQIKS